MAVDAIFIKGLCLELTQKLMGARIDKIHQPAKDLLIFALRGPGCSGKLLVSTGSGTARIHFTESSYENPASPPMFCMLLRKHLVGARITDISQPGLERILIISLDALDEMGAPVKKQIIIELMGRNSNLILTGPDGHIIDSLRRVDGDMSRSRLIQPGLFYRLPPPQEKAELSCTSTENVLDLINNNPDRLTDKLLTDSYSGLSPLIARELSHIACGSISKSVALLTDDERFALASEVTRIATLKSADDFQPTAVHIAGRSPEFSFMPLYQYGSDARQESFPDFSTLLDSCFSAKEKQEQIRRKTQSLTKSVKSAHERSLRKLAARREELARAEDREELRKMGDLITANIYRIKKGDAILRCEDYFTDGSPLTDIPLDPRKTPQQNAAAYYRDYTKAKTAAAYLTELIEKGAREEEYLARVLYTIGQSENERDIAEIRTELIAQGFIRQQKTGKKEKQTASRPMVFLSDSGIEILVGKNNTQNDALTFKLAERSDLWLHVKDLKGSHVIVRCGKNEADQLTISQAASLAVLYSQAGEGGGRTAVDCTQVRYVKKPSGGMPGSVIFTNQTTILAVPDPSLADRLRRQ